MKTNRYLLAPVFLVLVLIFNGYKHEPDLVLEDYNSIADVANNGLLSGVVTHDVNYSHMPKNGDKLDDCKISKIKIWIENGTPDN